jgi:hypothetical protein
LALCVNGHENPEGQAFCGICGAPIASASTGPGETPEPVPSEPQASTPKPNRAPWIIGGAVLAAAVVVGLALFFLLRNDNPSDEPRPKQLFAIKGSLSAPECGSGYEIEYANVEVRDQNDRLIGSATTGGDTADGFGCEVSFDVDVPKATFYQVTVGTHRGPSYSFEELQAQDFALDLSLSD